MSFFKKDELRLLWPFYFKELILYMFLIFPAFQIIYFKGIGLSLTQIGFLVSATSLGILLFEIPTGAIADIYGRKFSTILGYISFGIVFILTAFTDNYYFLLGIFFLGGVSSTFISGAEEALRVDYLHKNKRKKLIQESYIKFQSFANVSVFVSGIFGAILVKNLGISIIWLVSGLAFILMGVMISFVREDFVRKKQHIGGHIKNLINHTKESVKFSMTHHVIFMLILSSLFFLIVYTMNDQITWFPLLQSLGFEEYWFGYLFSAGFIIGIFSPYLTKPLLKKMGSYKNYFITLLSITLLFVLLTKFLNSLWTLIIMYILLMSILDFYMPIRQVYFNIFVPSKMRATVISFNSLLRSFVRIGVFPAVGFLADKIGPKNTIFLSSLAILVMIFIYYKIDESKVKKNK